MNDIILGCLVLSVTWRLLEKNSFHTRTTPSIFANHWSLSSLFEKHSWTTKEELMTLAFASGKNNQTLGSEYEEAVLLLILHMFGGKVCTLSDAFHTDQPWGSRKVTLVSLKRKSDGIMQSCPVSWSSGSSDRLGFRATCPEDVLSFLENPNGKLFPDCHMGPDLLFFLQDMEIMTLMCVSVEDKLQKELTQAAWNRAVQTVTPEYLYMVKVCILVQQYVMHCTSHLYLLSSCSPPL